MNKHTKWVLGTMSGTSLDGVDAAMVLTDGEAVFDRGETAYRAYSDAEREVLRAALGCWPGDGPVAEAARVVEEAHGAVMQRFEDAEAVAFHGQTLAHDPANRRTYQAGDGRVLAEFLGKPVVWDFRSSDVELGGEGAPLAPAYHFALVKAAGVAGPVGVLNLGGVGNLTVVDPTKAAPEEAGALLAFDTGPANAPLNDLMQARRGVPFDDRGALATEGVPDDAVIARLLGLRYFRRVPPKSLDRDDFGWLGAAVSGMGDADAAATLTEAVAASVAAGLEHVDGALQALYVTGGGRKNPVMTGRIAARTGLDVRAVEDLGVDGDFVEAEAFAFLAARVMRGLPTSFPATTGVAASVGGGRVSRPRAAS